MLAADAVTYDDLYRRWERGNWSATDIDLSEDREQWLSLDERQRNAVLWNFAPFMHGEESVAENLSAYIDAAPREEQKYFLTTQQVDEARHSVLFGRFFREVVMADAGASAADVLEATRKHLTWGFRKSFGRLDRMHAELRRDRSPQKLAAGVTLYHIIIEAGMAQNSMHMIERHLIKSGLFPGMRIGIEDVLRDEQRHIGFGVKLLSDLTRENEKARWAVADLLREVTPYSAAVAEPPGGDTSVIDEFGYTLEEVYENSTRALETRLRSAGLDVDELPGPPPMPLGMSTKQRANAALTLMRAGVLGAPNGAPKATPEVLETLFDLTSRSCDLAHASAGGDTIQWDFSDADPWWLRVEPSRAEVGQGRLPDPDLVFRCRFGDWADIIGGRSDPTRAILRRKLRPRGNPRLLLRTQKLFPR